VVGVPGSSRRADTSVSAQVLRIQSYSPGNSCTIYIGADIPSLGRPPKPSPATGSTDFNPVGQPWTFTLETANPLTWTLTDQGYWHTATFGEGGNIEITGPEGTFSRVITSGGAEGGDMPFPVDTVSINFRGQWSDGKFSHGSVYLNYADDLGPLLYSELTIIQGSIGTR
jgi:hypothetical protein